jgi:drug/metabolite transporter (DMT)-like permease
VNAPTLWCLVAAALFGASTPAAKRLLGPVEPLTLAGLLYLGAALAVAPRAVRRDRWTAHPDRANVARLAGAVIFGGLLGPVLLLSGLRLAPASSVALWMNLETVATSVLGRLVFREHAHLRTWTAVALIAAASAALASRSGDSAGPAAALVAAACFCWGLDNNLTSVIDAFTPAQTTLVKGVGAGLLNLALGLAFERAEFGVRALVEALVLGAVSYGASLVLYVAGAQQLGAIRAQMVFATAPFWGVAIAWAGFGEPMVPAQLAAGLVMALALWLVHRERHAHAHRHEALTHTHGHRHGDGHHDHGHEHPPLLGWHVHEHTHEAETHAHPHRPDLHHRHAHRREDPPTDDPSTHA